MSTRIKNSAPDWVQQAIRDLRPRVGGRQSQSLFLERLTHEEQRICESFFEEDEWSRRSAIDIYARMYGVSRERAILEVGLKCDLLTHQEYHAIIQHLEVDDDGRDVEFELAIKRELLVSKLLVLSDSPRRAFWKQCEIGVDWNVGNVVWNYFWTLAYRTSRGNKVSIGNFEPQPTKKQLTQWKFRLTSDDDFPPDLDSRITVRGGQHQLELRRHDVACFKRLSSGLYREITK